MSTDIQIDCVCPTLDGSVRHAEGDTVTIRDKLPFRAVEAIRTEVSLFALSEPDAAYSDSLAIFSEGYVLHGIESWTLEQDGPRGKPEPMPPSRANIRAYILDDVIAADIVSTAADRLYAEAVLLPLVNRASKSLPPGPTTSSTSRNRPSSAKPPRPSKPSSISTIRTGDTETTTLSLDGASKSLPSSESAA